MPDNVRHTEHEITVASRADTVYAVIAEVASWPVVFPPTVHVRYLEREGHNERIQIWAMTNGVVKSWASRRQLYPEALRICFRQEVSAPPVATMSGEWSVQSRGVNSCLVRLSHDFSAIHDHVEGLEWITRAVNDNSEAELASLQAVAEAHVAREQLSLSFTDAVWVDGAVSDVYDFLNRVELWPRRLPHVPRVTLVEETPGVQILEMDTRTVDGATHTTESARVCFPDEQIVYKQVRTPALMSAHTGRWGFEQAGSRTVITSAHTVVLRPEAVPSVLGAGATVSEAKAFVRAALSKNSMATMLAAKAYAERRRQAVG